MKFTLTVVALFSVLGRADAALRNSNGPVITSSDESERSHDTPKHAEDPHSFLSENGSSTTACNPKCVDDRGRDACYQANYGNDGCGSCLDNNCVFLSENGSSTTACARKCSGWSASASGTYAMACEGVDESKVGCGSCLELYGCTRYSGDSIGENSCRGPTSCNFASATIGNNSCNAKDACRGASGYIPDNQCNSERECQGKHFPWLPLYKDVLTGNCRSILGKRYSDVRIATTYLRENNPEACAQFCRQPSLNNGFQVGMQFGNDKCFCKYDGSSELPSLVPDGAVKRVTTDGYGPVSHGGKSANPGVTCYPLKHVDVDHYSLNEPTLTID